MGMRNLEQIRAKNAFEWRNGIGSGKSEGKPESVAKKVPEQIIQNGFLGALAFAIDNEGTGYADVFRSILSHLSKAEMSHGLPCGDLQQFLDKLADSDSCVLRAITAESLAYLNYLRRFVTSNGGKKNDGAQGGRQ